MKLTCEAVQDMYVLYQEDELHTSVRRAIDDHLVNCAQCKKVYESGDNFLNNKDLKQADESIKPSTKLDQEIILKLKLRKMRVVVLFLVTIMLLFCFFQYIDQRKNLLYEVSSLEQTVRDLYFELYHVKSDGDAYFNTFALIDDVNEKTPRINRQLNWLERWQKNNHSYEITLSYNVTDFLHVLHERYKHDAWSDRDEKALNLMNGYFEEYDRLLTDERLKLNHVRDYQPASLVSPFPVQQLMTIHYNIDRLAYTYSRFQQFPDERKILNDMEQKARAHEVFQLPDAEVTINPDLPQAILEGFGTYNTTIQEEQVNFYAKWNAYTGRLLSFNNNHLSESGELLPEKYVQEKLQDYVPRLLDTVDFRFEVKGLNYNYESNIDNQLYTYHIIPTYNNIDTDAAYRLAIDARTGGLASLIPLDRPFYPELNYASNDVQVNKDQVLLQLEEAHKDTSFAYREMQYVPSILSNQYELVFVFEGENHQGHEMQVFVNAKTGKEEVVY